MWKHVKRVVTAGGVLGTALLALASRSIPASIADANGYLFTNLRFFGWKSPPPALATKAADHWVAFSGAALVFVALIIWVLALIDGRKRKASEPATYVTPKEAVRYLVDESFWAWRIRKMRTPGVVQGAPVAMRLNARLEALPEFQLQASREGSPLKVYGTKSGSANAVLLPHTFWMTNGLDGTRVYSEADDETSPTTSAQSSERYGELSVDQAGVFRTWPRLDPLRRWLLRLEQRREERKWRDG